MKKLFVVLFYYKLLGWKTKVSVPDYDKLYYLCRTAYHQLGFVHRQTVYGSYRSRNRFYDEKRLVLLASRPIFRWMEGIPVDRSRKTSLVDQMIKIAKSSQKFHLAITPEGTRKANPNWKKGFYYIAQGAGLPIILVAIDYEKKCITAEKVIHPSGDLDKDMREIKLYYKNFKGKYPENFSIGKVE